MILNNFNKMVDEVYYLLEKENQNNKINKLVLPKFDISIEPTRLIWTNVNIILEIINRCSEHFLNFLKYEMNNKEIYWISANNINEGLIIHGKRQKYKDITDIVNKYINLCVICQSCKKYNTVLKKFISKKYNFNCLDCGMEKCI